MTRFPFTRSLRLLCAALALAGGSAVHAGTDVTGPTGLLKGQVPDDLPALKRVAITSFMVQYVTDLGLETKRSRGGTFFSKWKAPPAEPMQAAANALYAQLVDELKAAGIEVVAPEDVAAQPGLAEVRRAAKPNPARVDDPTLKKSSNVVAAQNLPITFATVPDGKLGTYATQAIENTDGPSQLVGWEGYAQQWLSAGNAEVGSLVGIYFGQAKVAAALKATALNVRLVVPLVDLGISTAGNAGGGVFGAAKVTGLVKPNPRLVEAGTVFSFAQAGGNPGHRFAVALQRPVPLPGLKLSADPDKVSLDETIFGRQSARGQGLFGALTRAAGASAEEADFWVTVDAETLQAALLEAGSPVFKELAAILAKPR